MNIIVTYSIIIFLLILVSSFCSCAETAFSCASTIRLKRWADEGNKKAKRALKIAEDFDKTLTAILILNNIVNLGCSALATVLCIELFGDYGAAVATGGTTLLVLTFGEIIPKCFGKEKADRIAVAFALPLKIIIIILIPFIHLFIYVKRFALFVFRIKSDESVVTEDELKYIVESIEEQGVLEQQESEMVRSVLDFDETSVEEILTPRVDVAGIDIDSTPEEILSIIKTQRYSRIPVYEESIDNIVGILHTWDYLEAIASGKKPVLKNLITPPYFIFKTQNLSSVLSEFRRKKLHIAIVTDEYGGTLGIVTMEDLLEEIVGEIWDEDEEIENNCQKLYENCYRVSGDMELSELFRLFDIRVTDEETDSNTVGGFIFESLGAIAKSGDSFFYRGLKITVESVTDRRVDFATVKLQDEEK
ncbi:MAG: hemolysin family protein [Oscillospiraceae bacterium]|nr:hemolysin family protein [Oscillospiraceae bacterium]